MPQDWTKDKAEIPPHGERQDMTLNKIGFARGHRPEDDEPTKVVIQTIIDNGEFEGFRLSAPFMGNDRFDKFACDTNLDKELRNKGMLPIEDPMSFMRDVNDEFGKRHRFSAMVQVDIQETKKERLALYNLLKFDVPAEEANLRLRRKPTQFQR